MAIEYVEEPIELFQTDEFKLLATDSSIEYTSIRTIEFVTEQEGISIGSFYTDNIAGTHEYCEFDKNYVVIFSKNRYSPEKTATIEVLFDTENLSFVEGPQDELKNKLQELQDKSNSFQKIYQK